MVLETFLKSLASLKLCLINLKHLCLQENKNRVVAPGIRLNLLHYQNENRVVVVARIRMNLFHYQNKNRVVVSPRIKLNLFHYQHPHVFGFFIRNNFNCVRSIWNISVHFVCNRVFDFHKNVFIQDLYCCTTNSDSCTINTNLGWINKKRWMNKFSVCRKALLYPTKATSAIFKQT